MPEYCKYSAEDIHSFQYDCIQLICGWYRLMAFIRIKCKWQRMQMQTRQPPAICVLHKTGLIICCNAGLCCQPSMYSMHIVAVLAYLSHPLKPFCILLSYCIVLTLETSPPFIGIQWIEKSINKGHTLRMSNTKGATKRILSDMKRNV